MPDILEIKHQEKPILINTKKLAGVFLACGRCVHEPEVNINSLVLYSNVVETKKGEDEVSLCILNPADKVGKKLRRMIKKKEVLTINFNDMHSSVEYSMSLSKAKVTNSFSRHGRRAIIVHGKLEDFQENEAVFPI